MGEKILTPIFHFRGIPVFPKNFFSENRFTLLEIQTSFFKIFEKFQKHALEESFGKTSVEVKFLILTPKYFLGSEISNHAARFDISRPKKYFGVEIENFTSTEIFPSESSSACFWIFSKILKNEV